jgi:hypothetical protein
MMAVGSLISSIAGGVLAPFCLCIPGPIGGIVGIVLGRVARTRIRASGGAETGEGIALAGEIIGWAVTVLAIVGVVVLFSLIILGNQVRNVFCNISNGLGQ